MHAAQNQLLTRIAPGTPCGALMRRYWQPVAMLDEFNPALEPCMATRLLKAVRLLGQAFVLFRDEAGRYGLLDRDCPHRGADLAFARREGDGLRCPFHGWKFDATGRCMETPAEPACTRLHPPAPAGTGAPYDPAQPALPASLQEALHALADDTVLMQGLGAPMAQV